MVEINANCALVPHEIVFGDPLPPIAVWNPDESLLAGLDSHFRNDRPEQPMDEVCSMMTEVVLSKPCSGLSCVVACVMLNACTCIHTWHMQLVTVTLLACIRV